MKTRTWIKSDGLVQFQFQFKLNIGCPMKHDSRKMTWKLSLIMEFICDKQSSTFFNMYDSWINNCKIVLILAFPKCGPPFVLSKLPEILRIYSDFNKTNTVEIWTKFFISPVILNVKKGRPHFGMSGLGVLLYSRILLLKLGLQIKIAIYKKSNITFKLSCYGHVSRDTFVGLIKLQFNEDLSRYCLFLFKFCIFLSTYFSSNS